MKQRCVENNPKYPRFSKFSIFSSSTMLEKFLPFLDMTTLLILAIFFLLFEYRPAWWYKTRKNDLLKGPQVIPGPLALPVLGSSWIFTLGAYSFSQLHEYYKDLNRKYGHIVKEEAFTNIPVINLFEKRDIEKVLRSGGKYPLRPPAEAMAQYRRTRPDRYASIGLVNEQG